MKRPLLFVHGICHGAWCWSDHYLPYFAAEGWDSYALSLRGHGNSHGRAQLDTFGLEDYVDDVLEVATGLPAKPVVIGHSMGGAITQLLMQRTPPPLAAAVLLASVPPDFMTLWDKLRLLRSLPGLLAMKRMLSEQPLAASEAVKLPFFSHALSEEQVGRYVGLLQRDSSRAQKDLSRFSISPGRTPVPVLVIGSREDALLSASALRRTAAHYATEAVILDRGCHDLMLDPNWKHGAVRILSWLKTLPAA